MKKLIIFILSIAIIGGIAYIYYEDYNTEKIKTKQEIKKENHLKEFIFETGEGSIEVEAEDALTPRGFAGATNHIFYLKDNNLYYYVNDKEDELYAENVETIYHESEQSEEIVVKLKNDSKIIKESKYLLYIKEGEQIFNFTTAYGSEKIVATKAMTASGSAGATNHIFYLKDNNLYKYAHEKEDELYAERVLDITFDIKQAEELIIKTDNNSKIIKTSPYILYMKEGEKIHNFTTAYVPSNVRIIAKVALTPRGFAGASNHIFYLKDNNLYKYVHEKEDELYAENVETIYHESKYSEEVVVKLNSNSKIIKEESYIIYK